MTPDALYATLATDVIGLTPSGLPLHGLKTGKGKRKVLLLGTVLGTDLAAATLLPDVVEALSDSDVNWHIVPVCDPDAAALNQVPPLLTLEAALAGLFHSATSHRLDLQLLSRRRPGLFHNWQTITDWIPADAVDSVVMLQSRLWGGVSGPDYLESVVVEGGLPWSRKLWEPPRPRLPLVHLSWPRFVPTAFSGPAPMSSSELRRDLQERAQAWRIAWTDEYVILQPFLGRGNPFRPWLDEYAESRADGSSLPLADRTVSGPEIEERRLRLDLRYLRVRAQLLRAIRFEIERGHTVPALVGAVRPLARALRSGPDAVTVAPEVLTSTLREALLSIARRGP